ncbi:MAG: hypothetical protein ABIS26_02425 [Candidatus Paceibacterota bacterium]
MKEELPSSKKDNTHSPNSNITRRSFLQKAGGFTAATLVFGIAANKHYKNLEKDAKDEFEVNSLTEYETGTLAGHTFSPDDLFSFYTGISGKVPEKVSINFYEQLLVLHDKKQKWVNKNEKTEDAFVSLNTNLQQEYQGELPLRMDLKEYQGIVKKSIKEVRENLDWQKVQGIFYDSKDANLSPDRLDVLKSISDSLEAKNLTAYALTELMPSSDGKLNKNVFEFILKNAGLRFAYSIPSIYDEYACVGMYQITSLALADTENPDNKGDISKINYALPEDLRLPGSVALLRESDHHKAAFLFVIYNLAALIRQLDENQFEVLKNNWKSHITAVTQFVALAHHAPTYARFSARAWLDSGAQGEFEDSCPLKFKEKDSRNTRQYAINTKNNLAALIN